MTADGDAAYQATRRLEGRTSVKNAIWFVLLALANVFAIALLYYAVAKGQDGLSRHDCTIFSPQPPQPIPVDPLPRTSTACGKPFAGPFWGLGVAPVVATAVSGFLMYVLYDRGQRKAAVLQTAFFILALATAVFGVTRLLLWA